VNLGQHHYTWRLPAEWPVENTKEGLRERDKPRQGVVANRLKLYRTINNQSCEAFGGRVNRFVIGLLIGGLLFFANALDETISKKRSSARRMKRAQRDWLSLAKREKSIVHAIG
jgi:hypothetical protein